MNDNIRCSVMSLIDSANSAGGLVVGFVGNLEDDTPLVTFTNAQERGKDLAEIFRLVADILEERAEAGMIVEQVIQKPN